MHNYAYDISFHPFFWDRNDRDNMVAGFTGRILVDNGPGLKKNWWYVPVMERCSRRIVDMLPYYDPSLDLLDEDNVARWIAQRPYSESRKSQIMRASGSNRVEAFIKDEFYMDGTKPPRLICARNDVGKKIYGPLFDMLNEIVFELPFCTKHIPSSQRPKYIHDYLWKDGDYIYVTTDMSAFECAMRPWLQRHAEFYVYKHTIPEKYHSILDKLLDDVYIVNRRMRLSCKTTALRLSGEMNTSVGNTLTNAISIMTVMELLAERDYKFVVEGDDALIRMPRHVNLELYCLTMSELGFNCKIEHVDRNLSKCGYCSMYWDDQYHCISDPVKSTVSFPIVSPGLDISMALSMKAMSYNVSSPGQPFLWKLCEHFIMSHGVCYYNGYEYEEMTREGLIVSLEGRHMKVNGPMTIIRPTRHQRALFNELYHVSPEVQICIENMVDTNPSLASDAWLRALMVANPDRPDIIKMFHHFPKQLLNV